MKIKLVIHPTRGWGLGLPSHAVVRMWNVMQLLDTSNANDEARPTVCGEDWLQAMPTRSVLTCRRHCRSRGHLKPCGWTSAAARGIVAGGHYHGSAPSIRERYPVRVSRGSPQKFG